MLVKGATVDKKLLPKPTITHIVKGFARWPRAIKTASQRRFCQKFSVKLHCFETIESQTNRNNYVYLGLLADASQYVSNVAIISLVQNQIW